MRVVAGVKLIPFLRLLSFRELKNLNIVLKKPKICYRYNKMRFFYKVAVYVREAVLAALVTP